MLAILVTIEEVAANTIIMQSKWEDIRGDIDAERHFV